MICDIEVHDLTPVMQQDDEAVQGAERGCWYGEEVDGGNLPAVISAESSSTSVMEACCS